MQSGLLTFLFALLITFVGAQTYGISNLPDCTTNCTAAAAKAVGCSLTDQKCLCAQADFSASTIRCAQAICGPVELNEASNVLYQMCASPISTTSTSSPTQTTSSPAGSPTGNTAATPSSSSSNNNNNGGGGGATPTTSPTDAGGSPGSTMTTGFLPDSQTTSSTSMVVQTVVVSQSPNVSGSPSSSSAGTRRVGGAYAVLSAVACVWLARL